MGKNWLVTVETADVHPNAWKLWLEWNEMLARFGPEKLNRIVVPETEMLRDDRGRTFSLIRAIARKN